MYTEESGLLYFFKKQTMTKISNAGKGDKQACTFKQHLTEILWTLHHMQGYGSVQTARLIAS